MTARQAQSPLPVATRRGMLSCICLLAQLLIGPQPIKAAPIRWQYVTSSRSLAFQLTSTFTDRRDHASSRATCWSTKDGITNPSNSMNIRGELNDVGPRPRRDVMSDVRIERVCTKQRALDVHVFRGWSVSAKEHMTELPNSVRRSSAAMTEEDAVNQLMRGYGSDGRYINTVSKNDPAIQFVTVYEPESCLAEEHRDESGSCYARQNGVVGAVDIQLRNVDSSMSIEEMKIKLSTIECNPIGDSVHLFAESSLPPHVYLSNLRVDDQMQGCGIGSALVAAVTSFVRTESPASMILLTVQNDNLSAIRAYFREGYAYLEKNEVYGKMFKLA